MQSDVGFYNHVLVLIIALAYLLELISICTHAGAHSAYATLMNTAGFKLES
jgi:hypothetical protein